MWYTLHITYNIYTSYIVVYNKPIKHGKKYNSQNILKNQAVQLIYFTIKPTKINHIFIYKYTYSYQDILPGRHKDVTYFYLVKLGIIFEINNKS